MLYPVYIHPGDEHTAHGVEFPDFPGCFSAADDWADLPAHIQEAVEVHFEGEETEIPPPTPLEKLVTDPAYQGGVWLLAEIDLTRVRNKPKSVRLNISLPADLLAKIDDYARSHGASRSRFLAEAARSAMR